MFDSKDRQLLVLLQADARLGYQELGRAVGLSAPAAYQRVRKLEGEGVLTGYHAAVDPAKVGRGVVGFIRVRPDPTAAVDRLLAQWGATADVQECHRMTGDAGYLVKLRLRTAEDLVPYLAVAEQAGCAASAELALSTAFERSTVSVA